MTSESYCQPIKSVQLFNIRHLNVSKHIRKGTYMSFQHIVNDHDYYDQQNCQL